MTDRVAVPREVLLRRLESWPAHWEPIFLAVRDYGVALMLVPQGREPFAIDKTRCQPTIFLFGDDTDRAIGPGGFHPPSLRRAIRSASGFSVVSCEPLPAAYAAAATIAVVCRKHSVIVETRPEQEIQWVHLIQKIAPPAPIVWATVKDGAA